MTHPTKGKNMKKLLYSMAASLLFVLAFATFTMAQSIDGDWDITVVSPQGERKTKVNLKQTGENINGTMGPYAITGSVKGADVTLKYTVKFQDNDLPITMTGKLTGDAMGGKADFGGFAEGDWTAKKAAAAANASASSATNSSTSSLAAAGEWSLTFSTPQGDIPAKFAIKQEGESLTGEVKGEGPIGNVPLKGTLKGDVLEIKYTIKFEGNDMPITMKGKLAGAEMKGSADYGGLAEGEFKGKKN
jgi:hypothetical protein